MIVNVLMLKLTDPTVENIAALQNKLLEMKGNIEQLKDLTVKTNIKEGPTAFDVVMIAKYESMEGFNEYVVHPFHQGVGEYVMSVRSESASVCYEE